MLKDIFYEVVGAHIADNFALWIKNKGYKEEANAILEALISWSKKEARRLKFQKNH